jgi:hypothetical protein
MMTTEKAEIRQIVVEVLQEIVERTGPPDRLMLFLYQYINDFNDFKREMLDFKTSTDERFDKVDERFDKVDERFDKVEGRLDNIEKNMFTKADWATESIRLTEGIGVEFKRIMKEYLNK